MSRFILLIFLAILPQLATAQSGNIDSLIEALPASLDTNRFNAIAKIVSQVQTTDKTLARQLIAEQYDLLKTINKESYTAKVHNANGIFHYYQTNIDSSINYFEKALESYIKIGDINKEGFALNNIGIIYDQYGDYEMAMQYYIASLEILEKKNDKRAIATAKNNIGRLWSNLGDYEKAEKTYRESQRIFDEIEDENGVHSSLRLLAAVLSRQEKHDESLSINKTLLNFYSEKGQEYDQMTIYYNLGVNHHKLMQYDSAIHFLNTALVLVNSYEEPNIIASAKRHLGSAFAAKGTFEKGINLIQESVDYYKSLNMRDELMESYQYLFEAQETASRYQSAFYSFKDFQQLRDSIASKKLQADISELETKYETAKKDAEIVLLNKNAEIDKVKKQRLSVGIGLIFLLGLALIYGLIQRSKKRQAILSKEKTVEIEKRQHAEQQLEFKKKELMAKVLQLARKNDFLQSLEEQVVALKSSVDTSVAKTSQRISRMIHNDALDEDEWAQFAKEFSSIHQDFITAITKRYGTFSQSEMRLASLLKMNLTSKDIANILRISDEGIKKARYRLRKKLGLESGDDLQGILVGI